MAKIIGRPTTGRDSRALIFRMFTIVPFIKLIDSNGATEGGKYSTNFMIFSCPDWFRDWLSYKFVRVISRYISSIERFKAAVESRITLIVAKIQGGKLAHTTSRRYSFFYIVTFIRSITIARTAYSLV